MINQRLQWLIVAALAVFAGCGPGEGGTGTGETTSEAFVAFNAAPLPVCSAPFASALRCPPPVLVPGTSLGGDAAKGTEEAIFVDRTTASNVVVVAQGNNIALNARCERLVFRGDWGTSATLDARFFGTYLAPTPAQHLPAALSIASDESGNVAVVIHDLSGRVVFGPVVIDRVPTVPVAPPHC